MQSTDKNVFYQDVGANLRRARERAGKSQVAVAEFLDISFQQVQKYEAGRNRIPMDKLLLLSQHLNVPHEELLRTRSRTRQHKKKDEFYDRLQDKEFRELLNVWERIEDDKLRMDTLRFLKSLARSQEKIRK